VCSAIYVLHKDGDLASSGVSHRYAAGGFWREALLILRMTGLSARPIFLYLVVVAHFGSEVKVA
jgi:hypothetical protein